MSERILNFGVMSIIVVGYQTVEVFNKDLTYLIELDSVTALIIDYSKRDTLPRL